MAPKGPNASKGDSLLQLALSITPNTEDPFDTRQEDYALNNDILHLNAEPTDRNPNLFAQKVPAIASDPQGVDNMIASQMTKLSVEDREKVYMDVHAIPSDEVTETPEFIHLSLLDLQNEIELLPDKQAYNLAERLNSDYVHDRDFRLAFLRCDRFDCPKTALRIVRHFQMKLDLFGIEKLAMHITQDDLDANDMENVYACDGRYLNVFDRGGRIVNLLVTSARVFTVDSALRKGFYQINMKALRSVDLQRRGSTSIIRINDGKLGLSGKNPELNWKLAKVNQASCMGISALHYCWGSEAWSEQQALSQTSLSESQQVRTRVYQGTVKECLEKLRGHGIDPASIPLNDKGEITDLREARRLIDEQRRYERLNFPLRSTIHVPFSHDVLLGKGTPIQNHTGNKRLRQLVAEHIKQYDKSQRGEKKALALEIVETIRQRGGLFLKQDGSTWTRVDDDVARLKVTAAFRTYRQSLKLYDD